MFRVLLQLSVPKTSEIILRWTFYFSKLFGVSNFCLKTTSEGGLQVEESSWRWKWFGAIFRLGHLIVFSSLYVYWLLGRIDSAETALHACRFMLNVCGNLCILRLQLCQGQECTQLINGYLQLIQRVRDTCHQNQKRMGFGGKQELVLLSLMVAGLVHEEIYMFGLFQVKANAIFFISWIPDSYISMGNQLLMHFAFVWYLTLGLQFADLNEYVRTQLRFELKALEAQPTRKKLRKARWNLDKCLALYRDLLSLTSRFQRVYDLTLFIVLIQNCLSIAAFSYKVVVQLHLEWFWLWSKTIIKIVSMLILCLSVQRAGLQFGLVRRLMFENCYLSENKDWHRKVHTHLSSFE